MQCENIKEVELKKHVAKYLSVAGWNIVSDLDLAISIAVSSKDYQTAVGVKTADFVLFPYGNNSFKICGEYQSQGRNILVNYYFVIVDGMSLNDIKIRVCSLARTLDSIISESYARRLFLRYGHQHSLSLFIE